MNWLPNVGLALVAIGVDPPLSERDVALLESLYQYTPNVSVLVTKVDVLSESERSEVVEFIRAQLAKKFGSAPRLFPYSLRPGFEPLKAALERLLVVNTLGEFAEQRESIVARKLDTLLRECSDYTMLTLRSAKPWSPSGTH